MGRRGLAKKMSIASKKGQPQRNSPFLTWGSAVGCSSFFSLFADFFPRREPPTRSSNLRCGLENAFVAPSLGLCSPPVVATVAIQPKRSVGNGESRSSRSATVHAADKERASVQRECERLRDSDGVLPFEGSGSWLQRELSWAKKQKKPPQRENAGREGRRRRSGRSCERFQHFITRYSMVASGLPNSVPASQSLTTTTDDHENITIFLNGYTFVIQTEIVYQLGINPVKYKRVSIV